MAWSREDEMIAALWVDWYKTGHPDQYPKDTVGVWANWTPRSTRVLGVHKVVHFGLQYFIKEMLMTEWQQNFFQRPLASVVNQYREVLHACLGVEKPNTSHLETLHKIGYLPIEIFSIPEGFATPLNVPSLVITNTRPEAYWLPNNVESIMSNLLWKGCTSATTAQRFRQLFMRYAKEAGETDFSFVDYMGHDFSFRGMSGREDAILSGMGHLLSFAGTDTVPAIFAAKKYYGADYSVGASVPATEHSVMCAGLAEEECATITRLVTEIYPTGIVSIVSDTWNLWRVLTEYIPRLKDVILARDGKVGIRPDSGDPVNILCGDSARPVEHPAYHGAVRLLAKAMGIEERSGKLPLIRKALTVYGDAITYERADQIMNRTVYELKMSPYNHVLGIGSFTYEYVTRDTYGFAMKATAVRRGDTLHEIYKSPVTDSGEKVSHKGILAVYRTPESTEEKPDYFLKQGATVKELNNCAFQKVFENGNLLVDEKFADIRKRVRA